MPARGARGERDGAVKGRNGSKRECASLQSAAAPACQGCQCQRSIAVPQPPAAPLLRPSLLSSAPHLAQQRLRVGPAVQLVEQHEGVGGGAGLGGEHPLRQGGGGGGGRAAGRGVSGTAAAANSHASAERGRGVPRWRDVETARRGGLRKQGPRPPRCAPSACLHVCLDRLHRHLGLHARLLPQPRRHVRPSHSHLHRARWIVKQGPRRGAAQLQRGGGRGGEGVLERSQGAAGTPRSSELQLAGWRLGGSWGTPHAHHTHSPAARRRRPCARGAPASQQSHTPAGCTC